MKKQSKSILVLILLAVSTLFVSTVFAESVSTLKATASNVQKDLNRFKKQLATLSDSKKLEVLNFLLSKSSTYPDSDSDGSPDIYEKALGTGLCDSDSDDDGISDGAELELKGSISAVNGSVFTVAGKDFTFDGNTVFEDLVQADLIVGACVEIKANNQGTSPILAVKISEEDDCSTKPNKNKGDDSHKGGHGKDD